LNRTIFNGQRGSTTLCPLHLPTRKRIWSKRFNAARGPLPPASQ